jgi:hypothetical protein
MKNKFVHIWQLIIAAILLTGILMLVVKILYYMLH